MLSPMRYKNYIWPHNPRVYSIDYEKKLVVHKIPFEEALAMTRDGRITDVKTIIGLNWAEQHLLGKLAQAKEL